MLDFKRLQDAGAASPDLDYSQSGNPDADSSALARNVGLTPDAIKPLEAPTEASLQKEGYRFQEAGDQKIITTPGNASAYSVPDVKKLFEQDTTYKMPDPASARPPTEAELKAPAPYRNPTEEAFNQFQKSGGVIPGSKVPSVFPPGAAPSQSGKESPGTLAGQKESLDTAAKMAGAAVQMMSNPAAGAMAMLSAVGGPEVQKVMEVVGKAQTAMSLAQNLGNLSASGILGNLSSALGLLGIKLPPALQAALGEAQKIAKALEDSIAKPSAPGVYAHGQQVARLATSPTAHGTPLLPGPGALTVLVLGTPAWRIGVDFHACPLVNGVVPHVGGVAIPGGANKLTVLCMGPPIAISTDQILEPTGGPNPILPVGAATGDEAKKKKEEERKKKEKADKEKVEKEKADKEKAAKEKADKEKAAKNKDAKKEADGDAKPGTESGEPSEEETDPKGDPVRTTPLTQDEIDEHVLAERMSHMTPEERKQFLDDMGVSNVQELKSKLAEMEKDRSDFGKDPLTKYLDSLPPETREKVNEIILSTTTGLVTGGPAGAVVGGLGQAAAQNLERQLVALGISPKEAKSMANQAVTGAGLLNAAGQGGGALAGEVANIAAQNALTPESPEEAAAREQREAERRQNSQAATERENERARQRSQEAVEEARRRDREKPQVTPQPTQPSPEPNDPSSLPTPGPTDPSPNTTPPEQPTPIPAPAPKPTPKPND